MADTKVADRYESCNHIKTEPLEVKQEEELEIKANCPLEFPYLKCEATQHDLKRDYANGHELPVNIKVEPNLNEREHETTEDSSEPPRVKKEPIENEQAQENKAIEDCYDPLRVKNELVAEDETIVDFFVEESYDELCNAVIVNCYEGTFLNKTEPCKYEEEWEAEVVDAGGAIEDELVPKFNHSQDVIGRHYGEKTEDSSNKSSHLNNLKRTHIDKQSYSCHYCGKIFKIKDVLRKHFLVHSSEKPHECEICKTRFVRAGDLKVHLRTHRGERPYVCEICFKHFTRANGLNKHRMTHTGEKPFSCETCGKCFSQRGKVKSHSVVHSREKAFKCHLCPKSFYRKNDLKVHLKMHERRGLTSWLLGL